MLMPALFGLYDLIDEVVALDAPTAHDRGFRAQL